MSVAALPLLVALAADAALGDPSRWPHFVRWLGAAITCLETRLRPLCHSPEALRLAGAAMVVMVVGGAWLAVWLLLKLASGLFQPLGMVLTALVCFQCLAAGQLWREAMAVARPLKAGNLDLARQRLAFIVGRDTGSLDSDGVRRAVIETVAENLNDGVVAPLFYLALGGPALGVAYKAVNTLDSMVGYKDERYADFGLAAARLDDLAGWIPARLTALLMVAACPLLGLSATQAWGTALADHAAHKSPNSGWPEAAMAGALGVRLGGPNFYGGRLVDKPWINPLGRPAQAADLRASLEVLVLSATLAGGLAVAAGLAVRGWV